MAQKRRQHRQLLLDVQPCTILVDQRLDGETMTQAMNAGTIALPLLPKPDLPRQSPEDAVDVLMQHQLDTLTRASDLQFCSHISTETTEQPIHTSDVPSALLPVAPAKADHMKILRPVLFAVATFLCSPAFAEDTARLTIDDLVGDWSAEDGGLKEIYSCDAPVSIHVTVDPGLALVVTAPDWTSVLKNREGQNGQIELYDPKTGATRITVERYMEDVLLFSFHSGRFEGKALAMAPCY